MVAQNFWEILLTSSRCQLLWQQDESKTSANRPKSAETCWIHTKFTMNVSELVLFEIKQKISKKMLITLTTLKEFVLYKALGRDPLLAYHGNNPQAHTHTLSLSLSSCYSVIQKESAQSSFHTATTTQVEYRSLREEFFSPLLQWCQCHFWMGNCNIVDSTFP